MRLRTGIFTFFFTLAGTGATSRGELLLNDDDQVIFFGNKVLEVSVLSQGLEGQYAQDASPPAQSPTPAKRPTPPSAPGGTL